MAYIGKDLNNLGDVQTLDNITFNAGAGPYNLQKGGVQVTDADTDSIMIAIDGVVQGGNYTVNSTAGTITFDFSVSSSSVCNFVKLFGSGVQNVPKDSSVTSVKIASSAVTRDKLNLISDGSNPSLIAKGTSGVSEGYIQLNCAENSHGIKLKSPPHSAGQSYTLTFPQSITNGFFLKTDGSGNLSFAAAVEDKPTITTSSVTISPSTSQTFTLNGTNFVSIPIVEFIASTGAITRATAVSYSSATALSVTTNLASGSYFIRVENNDGNAVRSTNAILSASTSPTWSTAAGSLGTIAGNFSGTVATVAASSDSTITYSVTSGQSDLTSAGVTLNASTGALTTSDFGGNSTTPTTYSFTITATDAESQTAARAFSLTSSFGATGGGQFN